jgi:hypothetical protein
VKAPLHCDAHLVGKEVRELERGSEVKTEQKERTYLDKKWEGERDKYQLPCMILL